jgi:hypothetical protein
MQYPQIASMTSHSNTPAPLYDDDGLCYSASNLATLNDLSVTHQSRIDTIFIHELRQVLGQLVALVQHLLENPRPAATTMVVDRDCLR